MGYTTDFSGAVSIEPALKPEHEAYLQAFSGLRHMVLDEHKAALIDDPLRLAVGLPVGKDGCYVIGYPKWPFDVWGDEGKALVTGHTWGGCGNAEHLNGVVADRNGSMWSEWGGGGGCPGIWCQWAVSTNDGESTLEWDGGEKFYNYYEWLVFLVERFFRPWGYKLNGEIEWRGESGDDFGMIEVEDNVVRTREGRVVYE